MKTYRSGILFTTCPEHVLSFSFSNSSFIFVYSSSRATLKTQFEV